ncbi:MAG: helix-turn-helix domain-containing protein [Minisyncoccota bacterium]
MNKPEIRSMIGREMKNRHVSGAELARGLHMHPASVSGLLNRPTIQVGKLAELCDFFQYNFFREIARQIPYTEPDYSVAEDRSEAEALQTRVKELELEVKILRQTLKDAVSR